MIGPTEGIRGIDDGRQSQVHVEPAARLSPAEVSASCEDGIVVPELRQSAAQLLAHEKSKRYGIALVQELSPGRFDQVSARDVELEAGRMSFHDVHLIHGSNVNRSAKPRAGLALPYTPSSTHVDRTICGPEGSTGTGPIDFVDRPIFLVRGIDRCGKNDLTIGHGPH
jgi:hypothetical protein